MKLLVKYSEDFGRMGDAESIFVCTAEDLEALKKRKILYLGEILGKHSSITATLTDKSLTVLSEDQEFIGKLQEVFGRKPDENYISGIELMCIYLDTAECEK